MIRILVVDDHAMVREGIKKILSDRKDMVVESEAEDGPEALCRLREQKPDLVLLDFSMPGRNGLEVLEGIKDLHPDLPVLILSVHSEEQYAVRMLRAGAAGYLTKFSAPRELVPAIQKVSQGRKYITAAVAEKMALDLDVRAVKPSHKKLSNREFQVMLMLAAGKFVSQVAHELRLSPKTVSTYRSRIMGKMKMKKNAELTLYAAHHDLLDSRSFAKV